MNNQFEALTRRLSDDLRLRLKNDPLLQIGNDDPKADECHLVELFAENRTKIMGSEK